MKTTEKFRKNSQCCSNRSASAIFAFFLWLNPVAVHCQIGGGGDFNFGESVQEFLRGVEMRSGKGPGGDLPGYLDLGSGGLEFGSGGGGGELDLNGGGRAELGLINVNSNVNFAGGGRRKMSFGGGRGGRQRQDNNVRRKVKLKVDRRRQWQSRFRKQSMRQGQGGGASRISAGGRSSLYSPTTGRGATNRVTLVNSGRHLLVQTRWNTNAKGTNCVGLKNVGVKQANLVSTRTYFLPPSINPGRRNQPRRSNNLRFQTHASGISTAGRSVLPQRRLVLVSPG